jgi:hypothetical protein
MITAEEQMERMPLVPSDQLRLDSSKSMVHLLAEAALWQKLW